MGKSLAGKTLVDEIVALAQSKKSGAITLFDLGPSSPLADWIVLCEAENPVHGRAVAGEILHGLKERETRAFHSEGVEDGRWALLDYTDVIVHVMIPEMREYYEVDRFWEEMGTKTEISDRNSGITPAKKKRAKKTW